MNSSHLVVAAESPAFAPVNHLRIPNQVMALEPGHRLRSHETGPHIVAVEALEARRLLSADLTGAFTKAPASFVAEQASAGRHTTR